MKKIIKQFIRKLIDYKWYIFYKRQYKNFYKAYTGRSNPNGGELEYGELEYIVKWNRLCPRVEPYSYRFFSNFCGKVPDIVPEDIGHRYIELVLNPSRYLPFYSDKNMYGLYLDHDYLPKTFLMRIDGGKIMTNFGVIADESDFNFNIPASYKKVILKPSVDSDSGQGVMLFNRDENNVWRDSDQGLILSYEFLHNYNQNFILQEAVEQHDYLSSFCKTSVNTLRIATYRSVKDENILVVGSIMRIGKNGSFIDNAHAGGLFVGIDTETGKVGNYLCNQYGQRFTNINDIDFSVSDYTIPNWNKVVDFAKYIASRNPHCRLLALDVAIDKAGNPKLIEYNSTGFSYWLFMYTGKTPFGEYTDEIIEYCLNHTDKRKDNISI